MKINSIEVYKADIPLEEPFRISLGEIKAAKNIFIKINTDMDLFGMGEASPFPFIVSETQASDAAAAHDLARLLIGKDPREIENRLRELTGYLPHSPTIISAFDMALYDLLGKIANLPLYALLGGGKRTLVTDRTVGINTPDKMVEDAVAFKERGFPAIKVKLGTTAPEDIDRIRRIRKALGPEIQVRTDANQGWDYVTALQALKGMEDQGVQYCEQPVAVWDLESMRRIRSQVTIPIMADESVFDDHDAYKLISMGACDYLNIKLAKSGGIYVALKINAIAEAAGMRCMVGCMNETSLALTAAAHLVSARTNIQFADLDSADFLQENPVVGGITYDEGGKITISDAPGIGATIDPAFLRSLESFVVK